MKKLVTILLVFATIGASAQVSYSPNGQSIVFTNGNGERTRLTPYGDNIIRIQFVSKGEDFFPDDRYEMVEKHNWHGRLTVTESKTFFILKAKGLIETKVDKGSMLLSFFLRGSKPLLAQNEEIIRRNDSIHCSFECDPAEHFTGLGHDYYGRADGIDFKGKIVQRNYGTRHGQQAPLIVPFYLSGKGYGVFLNSTFPNAFNFGSDGRYQISISGEGQMDFFLIAGPQFSDIIDRYTQLTGRPRFPPKAIFGLALSDKANDHASEFPSDEKWWKEKIIQHRKAGFPIDHIVNDNRWRAGGGQRCISRFEWDTVRFPSPKNYQHWIKENGLVTTLDFNRCISAQSEGWDPAFNIPSPDSIDFSESTPDFTRGEVRRWFWNVQWKNALNPELGYPGDALWIDEFDEMGRAVPSVKLGNGRTWKEMRNYWFFLIAKSLVQEGWDQQFHGNKRPFVWVRGMTAGAQRYATLWSGDIKPEYEEMKMQVRGMQLAGISGFPFWGHDAGGFYDWEKKTGPNDSMYRQWSLAFGSFSPFWKPHGVGQSRWPLDRSAVVLHDIKTFSELRYRLIPYIYTYAHKSTETGMPVTRAMLVANQWDSMAWKSDLQYMFGDEMLVAPNCSDGQDVRIWLPAGEWYDFWNDQKIKGGQTINYPAPIGKLPLFVRAGAIIPMANYALSSAFISPDSLTIHVYSGKNASFNLYEDDGISERYRYKNEKRNTVISFNQSTFTLKIGASKGNYDNAPKERAYRVDIHGLDHPVCFKVNGTKTTRVDRVHKKNKAGGDSVWDNEKKILSLFIPSTSVKKSIFINKSKCLK